MIQLVKVNGIYNTPMQEYWCDTEDDLENIDCPAFTTAHVVHGGKTFVKDSEGTWVDQSAEEE